MMVVVVMGVVVTGMEVMAAMGVVGGGVEAGGLIFIAKWKTVSND